MYSENFIRATVKTRTKSQAREGLIQEMAHEHYYSRQTGFPDSEDRGRLHPPPQEKPDDLDEECVGCKIIFWTPLEHVFNYLKPLRKHVRQETVR